MIKKLFIAVIFALSVNAVIAQARFSIASDLGVQRNFKENQEFWAIGPTIQVLLHLSPKDAGYFWYGFFSNGKFSHTLIASAKDPLVQPSLIFYRNDARMRLKHISLGWRRYLKGHPGIEKDYNIYANGGFGLIFGRIINTLTTTPDTSLYNVAIYGGQGNFKRLTLDLGTGIEIPFGSDFFMYSEARVWIPTTDYPSKYMFINNKAPFVGMLVLGFRTYF